MKFLKTTPRVVMILMFMTGAVMPLLGGTPPVKGIKKRDTKATFSSFLPAPPAITMAPITMIHVNQSCGAKSSIVVDKTETYASSKGLEKRLNPNNIYPSSWDANYLLGKPVGFYHFWNGHGIAGSNPLTYEERLQKVALGYKVKWYKKLQAEVFETGNSIRSTAGISAGGVSAKSSNQFVQNNSAWVAFKLTHPKVTNQSLTPSQVANDYYTVSLEDASGNGLYVRVEMTYNNALSGISHLGKITYKVIFQKKVAGNFYGIGSLTTDKIGDYVLIEDLNNGNFKVSVNGTTVGSVTNQSIPSGLQKVHFRAVARTGYQVGPGDVLASFQCPPINYYQLGNEVNGNFAIAKEGVFRFRHDEEYNYSGTLQFNVYDQYHTPMTNITTADLQNASVNYGENWLELDVDELSAGMYLLETRNSKGEKKYIRFKVL